MGLLSHWPKILENLLLAGKPSVVMDQTKYQVSSPEQLAKLFQHLNDNRKLLTVTLPGLEGDFISSILKVDSRKHLVYLDELSPQSGHLQAVKERKLKVYTLLDGVEFSFMGRIKNLHREDGVAIYTIPFPEKARYIQRRSFFRATLSPSQVIPVYLEIPHTGMIQGKLRDISTGGIGVLLNRATRSDIELKNNLAACTISLPGGKRIHCDLEVRSVINNMTRKNIQVGGQFVDPKRPMLNLISHFVADLDRERRRKQKK